MDAIKINLNENDLLVGYEFNGEAKQPWGDDYVNNFTIFIEKDGEVATFDYYGSIADYQNGKNYMEADEIGFALYSILSDAHYGGFYDVEDFQREFGYENEAKAQKVLNACEKSYDRLKKIFDYDLNENELVDMINEYNGKYENQDIEADALELIEYDFDNYEQGDGEEEIVENFNFSRLMPYDDYENLTADAFIGDVENDLDDLKEIKDIIDSMPLSLEAGFCTTILENIETLEEMEAFDMLEKYSFTSVPNVKDIVENYKNATKIDVENSKPIVEALQELLKNTDQFFYNIYNGLAIDSQYPEDIIREAADSYAPMMNSAWLLKSEPSDSDIKEILTNAANISVIKMDDNHYLTMNGGGMDFSQSLAYAYLKIDGEIPKRLFNEFSDMSQAYTGTKKALNEVRAYFGKEPLDDGSAVDEYVKKNEDENKQEVEASTELK